MKIIHLQFRVQELRFIEDEITSVKTWVDVDDTLQSLDADMKVAYEWYDFY